MIELTRLNGNPLYVNCDLIKWAEAAPDTVLTLINGEKVVVRESCHELVERLRGHRLLVLAELLRRMSAPEDFLRAAQAANLPAPWSQEVATASNVGRKGLTPDPNEAAGSG
jgi:flagellar protein FlbD